jgi:hypothetical protein
MKSVEEIAANILFQDVREVFEDPFGESCSSCSWRWGWLSPSWR